MSAAIEDGSKSGQRSIRIDCTRKMFEMLCEMVTVSVVPSMAKTNLQLFALSQNRGSEIANKNQSSLYIPYEDQTVFMGR